MFLKQTWNSRSHRHEFMCPNTTTYLSAYIMNALISKTIWFLACTFVILALFHISAKSHDASLDTSKTSDFGSAAEDNDDENDEDDSYMTEEDEVDGERGRRTKQDQEISPSPLLPPVATMTASPLR